MRRKLVFIFVALSCALLVTLSLGGRGNTPVPGVSAQDLTPTATPECPGCPSMELDADPNTDDIQTAGDLQMMEAGCVDPEEGLGCLAVDRWILNAYDADSPNDTDEDPEGVGVWEALTEYDHLTVIITSTFDKAWIESGGRVANCATMVFGEDWIQSTCFTGDASAPGLQLGPNGSGRVERLIIVPRTDLFGDPGGPDSVVVEIGSSNCELSDIYGEQVPGTLFGLTATCSGVTVTVHRPCPDDADCDAVLDTDDNCPLNPNAYQLNSDGGRRENGAQVPGDWASNPALDRLGDDCDADADNDALPDDSENEDSCPYRLTGDSDGDRSLDGSEAANGNDSCSAASRVVCSSSSDSDGDGFTDCIERSGYGTCALAGDSAPGWTACVDPVDSDGDGCQDWVEIVDINGDRMAGLSDVMQVARRAFNILPADPVSDPVFDMNKDGYLTLSDPVLAARNSNLLKWHAQCGPEG